MSRKAIDNAREQSQHGPKSGVGICLVMVRTCYGIAAIGDVDGDGDADAFDAWVRAKFKHPETNPARIPAGVPVFWQGGSANHGHGAIATGFNGNCWSTDIKRKGFFDRVPIKRIHDDWGLRLLGWAEDLNGVRVHPE
jgi:hypothetical protein